MKFVELNHVIRNGMISYPGMPPVEISAYLTRAQCGGEYGDEAAALIDNFNDKSTGDVVHEILLSVHSVICEDMTGLEQLPDKGAHLYVIPPRVEMASFPARAFAVIDDCSTP